MPDETPIPVPLPPGRTTLTQISSVSWEHPADRAALNALRALPGFDTVVRKVMSYFGERGIRQLFLANAVRVGPTQRPDLDALYSEVLETLDWTTVRPELYVTQTPIANAAAVGFENPFIIIHSGALELLSREEQRALLAHEVGHIMSGHATYTTLALLLVFFGIGNLAFLSGLALLPFQLALLEWHRKAEFSADRAALLGVQDVKTAMRMHLKFAGGREYGDTIDVDAFIAQAREYETGGGAWEAVIKILNTAFRTHPFSTVRAAELTRWIDAGSYDAILRGEYVRRGQEPERPLGDDLADASGYYGQEVRDTFSVIGDSLGRARSAFEDAWKKR
jgi:Zn-dependent protease with chaperone function